MTDAEIEAVLAAIGGRYVLRDRAMVVTQLRTGFRISELLSLTIGDVIRDGQWVKHITVDRKHMKGGKPMGLGSTGSPAGHGVSSSGDLTLKIPRRVRKALHPWVRRLRRERGLHQKQGIFVTIDVLGILSANPRDPRRAKRLDVHGRTVPMHQDIPHVLAPWLVEARSMGIMRSDDYIFQSRARGNRPITVQQAWRVFVGALRRCRIHDGTGTHMLRKTFAAKISEAVKGNIYKVAQALGHEDVKSAQSYMKSISKELDEAILNAR